MWEINAPKAEDWARSPRSFVYDPSHATVKIPSRALVGSFLFFFAPSPSALSTCDVESLRRLELEEAFECHARLPLPLVEAHG